MVAREYEMERKAKEASKGWRWVQRRVKRRDNWRERQNRVERERGSRFSDAELQPMEM